MGFEFFFLENYREKNYFKWIKGSENVWNHLKDVCDEKINFKHFKIKLWASKVENIKRCF